MEVPEVGMAAPVHVLKEFLRWMLGGRRGVGQAARLEKNAIVAPPKEQEHASIPQYL
jgi:hypothetical protein